MASAGTTDIGSPEDALLMEEIVFTPSEPRLGENLKVTIRGLPKGRSRTVRTPTS